MIALLKHIFLILNGVQLNLRELYQLILFKNIKKRLNLIYLLVKVVCWLLNA